MNIRFTLVADGSTDEALLPILRWAIQTDQRVGRVESNFARPCNLPPARLGLAERVRRGLELFPANLLFVHRDAERESTAIRRDEIKRAVQTAKVGSLAVPVVPLRMTEAWLLVDEMAIRSAAGNPRGGVQFNLPRLGAIEGIADPKDVLYLALRTASELRGRRLQKFRVTEAALLVTERVADFTALRGLSAFREFEHDLRGALDSLAESVTE